jgi:hypothetical protein
MQIRIQLITLMRIRILPFKLMHIHVDPDPKHCRLTMGNTLHLSFFDILLGRTNKEELSTIKLRYLKVTKRLPPTPHSKF